MLPTQASPLYYGSYVPFYEPAFTSSPLTLPFAPPAFYTTEMVPCLPFATESGPPVAQSASPVVAPVTSGDFYTATTAVSLPTYNVHLPASSSNRTAASGGLAIGEEKTGEDGKTACQFYLRTGTCAFGARCKFYHPPNQKPPQLNHEGYPIRKGEKNCSFYMKHGVCSFGATCKYHHPQRPKNRGRLSVEPRTIRTTPPPQMMPFVGDYGQWATAIPTQGWYAPPPHIFQAPPARVIPAVYPPYPCYPSATAPMKEGMISGVFPASPAGSCLSSGANNHTKDETEKDDSSSGCCYSDEDRCWSF